MADLQEMMINRYENQVSNPKSSFSDSKAAKDTKNMIDAIVKARRMTVMVGETPRTRKLTENEVKRLNACSRKMDRVISDMNRPKRMRQL